jgi:hypothetical protein
VLSQRSHVEVEDCARSEFHTERVPSAGQRGAPAMKTPEQHDLDEFIDLSDLIVGAVFQLAVRHPDTIAFLRPRLEAVFEASETVEEHGPLSNEAPAPRSPQLRLVH